MATPIDFPERNDILKRPKEMQGCRDLPIHRDKDGNIPIQYKDQEGRIVNDFYPIIVSCWEMSEQEIRDIISSKKVYLMIWNNTHPPLAVLGTTPFTKLEDDTLYESLRNNPKSEL